MHKKFALYLFVLVLLYSCKSEVKSLPEEWINQFNYSSDSLSINWSSYKHCDSYIIDDTIDLQGKTLYLPPNSKVKIQSGLFRNGIVVGNNTQLQYKDVVFDAVLIKGTWFVPCINSSMFKDLSYDNALKDVFALANPSIKNKIIINKGKYQVTARCYADACLRLYSNTDLILNGDVYLTPNGFTTYSIIRIEGKNVVIRGSGSLVGDRDNHTDNKGEWGMGVYVKGGEKNRLQGITIKDCWGDCVYVTGKAKNVEISDCTFEHSRRQGVSIISANNVTISKCTISRIMGTNPQYAIDVEPNANDTVKNVTIKNVNINDCVGGITSSGRAKNSSVGSIKVSNCTIKSAKECPLHFVESQYIEIVNCTVYDFKSNIAINCLDDGDVLIIGNSLYVPVSPDNNNQRNKMGDVIKVVNTLNKKLKNNIINIK